MGPTIIVNFAHPLTDEQIAQIEALTSAPVGRVIEVQCHFDHARSFAQQARDLLDSLELSPTDWQTRPLIINPPALAIITAVVLAELHGLMGYFPPVIRLRPVEKALPPRFEVAEIINLQQVRDQARSQR